MKALSRGRAFLLRWGCAGLFIRCKIVVSRQLLEKAEASFRGDDRRWREASDDGALKVYQEIVAELSMALTVVRS